MGDWRKLGLIGRSPSQRSLIAVFASVSLIGLVVWVVHAASANYYVNCSAGSDSNNGTSTTSSWKSLAPVTSKTFSAGDTIYLARGCTFDSGLTLKGNGISTSRITLDAYGTGTAPIVSYSGGATGTSAITASGSYITVQNMLVKNSSAAGILLSGTYDTVKDSEITASGMGVTITGANALVTGVNSHDLKMAHNTPGGDDDYGAVGYDVEANNAEIAYSKCTNCRASSYDYGYDGGFVEIWNNGDNLYVHNNWADTTEGFMETGGDSNGTHANNVKIANNVLVNTGAVMVLHSGDNFSLPVAGLRFEQNTFYQPNTSAYEMFWGLNSVTVKNNIFYATIAAGYTPSVHTNNLYYNPGGGSIGYTLGSTEKSGDPKFVNAAGKDFHLQSISPARGMGATGLGYSVDYDGVASASIPDVGAFQYVSASPSPTVTPTPVPGVTGDLNADTKVNIFDLSILLSRWGSSNAAADLNHDGTVNVFDLSLLLSHWTG